jgi:uncharacterized membrane protein YbhN (UPF0104 family)
VLAVVNVYLGCLAFGEHVSLVSLTLAVPIILTISLAPISLGSVGLQEWGYFVVFEHLGIPGSLGLSVALLMRAKALIMGGIGGFFYASWITGHESQDEYTNIRVSKN